MSEESKKLPDAECTEPQQKTVTQADIQFRQKHPIIDTFQRGVHGFADLFLKPSIITVIITAILGPIAITWVNDGIENKRLQKEVITTMLSYTGQTDFSKPESLEKITIIAKMVDENKNIFGLSFAQTDSTIQNLYGEISKVGIANLNKKRNEYEQKITELKTKLADDTTQLTKLYVDKQKILNDIEKNRTAKMLEKVRELENNLSNIELDLKEMENHRDFYRKQIKYWENEKTLLNSDIEQAQEDVATVLISNRKKMNEFSDLIQQKTVSEDTLRLKLTQALEQIKRFQETVNNLDTINKTVRAQNDNLKHQIEALKQQVIETSSKIDK